MASKQYVVFRLAKEECGIDIQKVTTIERQINIARVPKAPVYIKGVMNLRGEIIPVMNLRKRLNLDEIEATEETRIIIIKVEENSIGIIVDSVKEVIYLEDESIENITNVTNDLSLDYIKGIGKVGSRLITLLNLEKLISELVPKTEQ